jgi:hypothetical protein
MSDEGMVPVALPLHQDAPCPAGKLSPAQVKFTGFQFPPVVEYPWE